MSSTEHERLLRRARMQDVALFRYRLIGPALEEGLTTKQRGKVVRGIAGQVHAGPGLGRRAVGADFAAAFRARGPDCPARGRGVRPVRG